MQWGFFSVMHIITLLLVPALALGLYFGLKRVSQKTQTAILGGMSFLGIASIIYNLVAWGVPLEYLPLHLCSFNAMVLPIVVFTKNEKLGNMLLLWCLGALAALVLNTAVAETELLSWTFFFYYWPHVVELIIPILLVALGHIKKNPKCILSTVAFTMVLYTVVHFINLGLNACFTANNVLNASGEVIFANYMYSLEPNNPMCALFQKIIPGYYWYMYLAVPILVVYLLVLYAPEIIKKYKNKKCAV